MIEQRQVKIKNIRAQNTAGVSTHEKKQTGGNHHTQKKKKEDHQLKLGGQKEESSKDLFDLTCQVVPIGTDEKERPKKGW